jgi:tape measure domain-containing protein
MALEWSLKLKDGISGPAQKAGDSLAGLDSKLKNVGKSTEFFRDKMGKLRHKSGRFATEAEKIAQGLGNVSEAAAKVPKLGKWAQSFKDFFGARAGNAAQFVENQLKTKFFGSINQGQFLKGAAGAGLAAGAAFVAAFAIAAAAVVGVVANVFGQIATFQQAKGKTLFAFDKLLGPGGGAKAWEAIRAAAEKTKSPLQETAQAFNNLVAAGFKLPEADHLFRQLADLKTLNPQANIDGIVRAIGQIRNIGKLQGDELNQLSEAGVNIDDVYTELQKRLGKTRDEVMKLKEAGKLQASDAIAAIQASIAKRTGPDAGAVAGAAPKGAAESWERIKQKFFDMVSMDFGPLTRFFDRIEAALDGEGGRALAAAFEDLASAAGEFLDSFTTEDLNGLLKGFASVVRDIADGLRAAAEASREINATMRQLDELAGTDKGTALGGAAMGAGRGMLDVVTGGLFSSLSIAWDALVLGWDITSAINAKFFEAVSWIASQASTWFSSSTSLGSSMVDGIMAGIGQKWGELVAKVQGLAGAARSAFSNAIGEGSPAREFFPSGRSIVQGVGVGVQQETPKLGAAVESMAAVAQARLAGQRVMQRVSNTTTSNRRTDVNLVVNDEARLGQFVRQIVRQENRLQAT